MVLLLSSSTLNKPIAIQEFLTDQNLDLLAISETWLAPDSLPSTLNSLTPAGYSIIHQPRPVGKGGGVALIYRSFLKAIKIQLPIYTTFESLCTKFTISSSSFTLLTIYRPPNSSQSVFISEMSSLLEDLVSSTSELLITGDFNIHVDIPSDPFSKSFSNLLEIFDLKQHITFPTHNHGHTLDLLVTRSNSTILSDLDYTIPCISDHYAIMSSISVSPHQHPSRVTKTIRSIRKINLEAFSNDILSSPIYTTTAETLDSFLSIFSNTLKCLLDKYAPLRQITTSSRKPKPFITPEILSEKSERFRLESIWRNAKTKFNKALFRAQSRHVAKLITKSRSSYYRSVIAEHQNNPRKLWSAIDSLLSRKSQPVLPNFLSSTIMASSFLDFFNDKIAKLCSKFSPTPNSQSPHTPPPYPPLSLDLFTPASSEEIRQTILAASNSSCPLDEIPTPLLKSLLPVLLKPITTIVNLSLSSGTFPSTYKSALITPLLKKHSLPSEDLTSYRPISNLNFLSKIIERIIHSRLTRHLSTFNSFSTFQSAYRPSYSTESALLRIQNDLLLAIDQQKVSALVLLDLSAAFDTIDHNILLTRLSSYFGITGSALDLLTSYLLNRTQSVRIGSHISSSSPLTTGIPQGSVLGPLLFTLYTTPLSHIISNTGLSFHFYADDTQLYVSFSAKDSACYLSRLSTTLDSVHSWFISNRLSVNPSKTEFLLIGNRQQRSKLPTQSISFAGNILNPTQSARNLGVIFDSDLSLTKHISSICQISFLHIRQFRRIRSSLDLNSAILLANALVSSRLDSCNSLLYGLPDSLVHRLQLVQNSLARVVIPETNRYYHITPVLKKLHWLPIKQRITYKIALLTYKTLASKQPAYLFDLITPLPPSGRCSSSQNRLVTHFVKSSSGRRSFFYSAPTVWNSLPNSLRCSNSLDSFRSSLKTYLFPP